MLALFTATLLTAALGDPPDAPSPPPAADLVAAVETAIAEAIAKAEPSVVSVAREKSDDGQTTAVRGKQRPPRRPREDPRFPNGFIVPDDDDVLAQNLFSFDYGSGVVVGEAGQILTTYHTIKGASRLVVKVGGNQWFDAEVIAADPRSDLAVIVPRLLPGTAPPKLKPIALGNAGKLRKGSFLIALGSPFNAGRDATPSASWGILANKARRIEASFEEIQLQARQLRHYPTLLQLDSKLNLGMSGGAVVNLKGELVGITTDAASPSGFDAHAGYAIPIDAFTRKAVETLIDGKEVEYGFLGIRLHRDVPNRLEDVDPNSPAGQGDLIRDDTVIAVNDTPVSDGDSLILAVNAAPVGKPVKLKIVRDGQVLEKTVLVSKLPVAGEVIVTNRPPAWRGLRVDFVSALVTGPSGDEVLKAMAKGGVGIAEVAAGSPADEAGLKPGQVITAVAGEAVHTPAEFRTAVAHVEGDVKLQTTDSTDHAVTVKPE